ncbi:MAG: PQQ-dependent sugar dehydrogenase [Bacteroidota bacterium]
MKISAQRLIVVSSILLVVLLTSAFLPKQIMLTGIDSPTSIGAFLDNKVPARTPSPAGGWSVELAFPNLQFIDPVELKEIPGTNKFIVVGKSGHIWWFENDQNTAVKHLVLDISDSVMVSGDSGLFGLAFHPQFDQAGSPHEGEVYLVYRFLPASRRQRRGYHRVSRFKMDRSTYTIHDSTEYPLIQQFDEHDWHNGGSIVFGDDGYLYFANGDVGGNTDQFNSAQKINDGMFSGVFRIDVDMHPTKSDIIRRQVNNVGTLPNNWPQSFNRGYKIPKNNPWHYGNSSTLAEYYAHGFRNPFGMSKDPLTGDIWVTEVGQGSREEINKLQAGGNYQWPYLEGELTTSKSKPNPLIGFDVEPYVSLRHGSESNAIIGGFIYRGTKWPSLYGKFIFGDHAFQRIFAMNPADSTFEELATVPSFGIGTKQGVSHVTSDSDGEIYALKLFGTDLDGGRIYRLRDLLPSPEPPAKLSQLNIFSDLVNLIPQDYMIPYQLNEPFWSDDALKYRWMIIPNNGTHNTAAEKIQYDENGDWIFPEGSVLVKHFEMKTDEGNPSQTKRLETRLVVAGQDNDFYGITYRWNDAQTDADLLTTSRIDTLPISTPSRGTREIAWYFPDRGDCMFCHNEGAKRVLGPKTRQLNGDLTYFQTGRTSNQLLTLSHLNIFDTAPDTNNLGVLLTSKAKDDATATLAERARSYLDSNCGYCHRPSSPVRALFDARLSTPLADANLIFGEVYSKFDFEDPRIIIPVDLDRSTLYKRLAAVHDEVAMPPLAKNLMDSAGVDLIAAWINDLKPIDYFGSTKFGQVINFPTIPNQLSTTSSLTLNASSTSGLPVSYDVETGPASVSGNILTLTGTGFVKVVASQNGNGSYEAAPDKELSFWVHPAGSAEGTGLTGTYYNDMGMSQKVFDRLDPEVNFIWGSDAPSQALQLGTYSVVWEGEIESPATETVTFTATSDDGIRVWVNGVMIIDNWVDQEANAVSGSISMQAWQRVPIKIEYYQNRVYSRAILEWSSSSIPSSVVPSDFLYPEDVDLPIVLTDFRAELEEGVVQLDWTSSMEMFASHFEIEKSRNGEDFEKVGEVEARGIPGFGDKYQYRDDNPFEGESFYRLRMVDLDGTFDYSEIRRILFNEQKVEIYPNPVYPSQPISMRLGGFAGQFIQVSVYDLQGKWLFETSRKIVEQNEQLDIPTSNWGRGTYFFSVQTASGFRTVERVLIQ